MPSIHRIDRRRRRVRAAAAAGLAALLAAAAVPVAAQPPDPAGSFADRIEVRRLTVDVRVLDAAGRPVAGLGRQDFRVTLDGEPVEVVAVDWLPAPAAPVAPAGDAAAGEPRAAAAAPPPADAAPAPPGRLLVLFVQTADFYMQSKASGHLRMLPRLTRLIAGLDPADRMAVVRYGSRLDLAADFSADREALTRALHRAVLGGPGEAVAAAPGDPSLAARLDSAAGRRATTPEDALRLVGEALAGIPGAKTMVFVGWGLGRYDHRSGVVTPEPEYAAARDALARARVAVFALDVSEADEHSLEVGLRQVADDTGGRYESTWHFPDGALARLQGALGGLYTLVLLPPEGEPGPYRLRVRRTAGGGGRVLAPARVGAPPATGDAG